MNSVYKTRVSPALVPLPNHVTEVTMMIKYGDLSPQRARSLDGRFWVWGGGGIGLSGAVYLCPLLSVHHSYWWCRETDETLCDHEAAYIGT